jgi:MFS transporter, ACS family, glucarate transporter
MTSNKWVAVGLLAMGLGAMDLMLPVAWAICVDTGGEYAGTISGAMNAAGQVGSLSRQSRSAIGWSGTEAMIAP